MLYARDQQEFEAITESFRQYSFSEQWLLQQRNVRGWCRACKRVEPLEVAGGQPPDQWISLLEGMVCRCGLNGRMRFILSVVDDHLARHGAPRSALVLERITPLFPYLSARIPLLQGAEYFESVPPGHHVSHAGTRVLCESMMGFSSPDANLDLLMHFDVLEHVPDWRSGLRECARVLRPSGWLIFTCPFFYTLEKNIVRAVWQDGRTKHLLPPGYHGNPMSGEGSLVYIHPSWEVFDALPELGFESIEIALEFSVGEGIVSNGCPYPDGHVWACAFVAKRKS